MEYKRSNRREGWVLIDSMIDGKGITACKSRKDAIRVASEWLGYDAERDGKVLCGDYFNNDYGSRQLMYGTFYVCDKCGCLIEESDYHRYDGLCMYCDIDENE